MAYLLFLTAMVVAKYLTIARNDFLMNLEKNSRRSLMTSADH